MSEMTSRERLWALFHGEPVDRVPWSPCIDGYFLSAFEKRPTDVEAYRLIGADALRRHVSTHTSIAGSSFWWQEKNDAQSSEPIVELVGDTIVEVQRSGAKLTKKVTTPIGILSEEWLFTDTSPNIPFPIERKIKCIDDLRIYRHFLNQDRVTPNYEAFIQGDLSIGDDGLATASVPRSPFQTLLEHEIGMGEFYYFLQDNPTEVEETLDLLHEKNKTIYRVASKSPAQILIAYENSSTTLFSPALYERYCLKQLNDYADIIHAEGKIFLTHMCGKLKGLSSQLARGRMDGIIDIAPPPTGDVDLAEAKRLWGKDKAVIGGIDATAFTNLDPEGIKQYVKALLKRLAPGNRVIIGSGDAVPKTARVDNLKAVSEAVKQFGSYPVSC